MSISRKSMSDLELVILGSASGMSEPYRFHASLAVQRRNNLWLLDAGEGVCSSMIRFDLNPEFVRGIYITHCHPDHCVGIFMLLQYLHIKGFTKKLDIYLPGGAIKAFQQFMNQIYLMPGEINPKYKLKPLEAIHKLADGIQLETYPTNHLQRWEELNINGLETRSYAFRVRYRDKSVFYSGDIRDLSDIETILREDDLLVLEAAHLDFSTFLQRLFAKKVSRLLLTHIPPELKSDIQKIIARGEKHNLEIKIAEDGLRIT